MSPTVTKYNPSFLSDDELIRSFVVRQADLDLILETVRENAGPSNQHVLVIGPRGIGKTMLLRRVAAAIRSDPDLGQKWHPLAFGEESYEVFTPGELWLEAIFHLGEQLDDARFRQAYADLKRNELGEEALRARALALLMDFADQTHKRILLIVENLNRLFSEQVSGDGAWDLRHTLLNEPRLMLLGSATTRFDEIDNSGAAMFDLFRTQELEPLNQDECRTLWTSLGCAEAPGDRIRPIQILTGGSPRFIAILSTFAANRSLRELFEDLIHLIDDHTEYFKSHLDALAPTERKVFVALADLWDPSTAREVARAARMDINQTCSLLSRLVGRRAVSVVEETKRRKRYQLAERLYNIYYLMRRRGEAAARVHAVVRFMVTFYEPQDLVGIAARIAEEACGLPPDGWGDHIQAYRGILELMERPELRDAVLLATPSGFLKAPDLINALRGALHSRERRGIELADEGCAWSKIARNSLGKAIDLMERGVEGIAEAMPEIRTGLEADPGNPVAWTVFGLARRFSGLSEEAEQAFRKATELDSESAVAWGQLGLLLEKAPGRREEAERALRKATELNPKDSGSWASLGRLLAGEPARRDEAERALRTAAEMDPNRAEALASLGDLLMDEPGREQEAESACLRAIHLTPGWYWPRATFVKLLSRKPGGARAALDAAREYAQREDASAEGLAKIALALAPVVVSGGDTQEAAEAWARKAVALEPQNLGCLICLTALLAIQGKWEGALSYVPRFLSQAARSAEGMNFIQILLDEAAGAGFAREVLERLRESPSAPAVEPLIVGLQLFLGEKVNVAQEILEVGKDVAKRIRERQEALQTTGTPPPRTAEEKGSE